MVEVLEAVEAMQLVADLRGRAASVPSAKERSPMISRKAAGNGRHPRRQDANACQWGQITR